MASAKVSANTAPVLIALYSDRPQCGKSTAADILSTSKGCVLVKLAAGLKTMLSALLRRVGYGESAIVSMIEGDLKNTPIPELGMKTPRDLMQTLGTEWGRDLVDQDVWARVAASRVLSHLRNGRSVVIDDLRFPNEVAVLRQCVGQCEVVQIVRPDAPPLPTAHKSEAGLPGELINQVIHNEGSVGDLAGAVTIAYYRAARKQYRR